MTISLRTLALLTIAAVLGVAAYVAFGRSDSPIAVAAPGAPPSPRQPARAPAEAPYGTVAGSVPGTGLTLLSLRRTGPKVVTARLRISFDHEAGRIWIPERYGPDDRPLSAEGMRLVDEVNGREHFVLRNADGACLCSGPFEALEPGESSVVSAKFPAPPADVAQASLETPGFASFDGVPLA